MNSRRRFQPEPLASINITNLVDVCLTLLIIFMITAPMLRSGIDIDLPKADATNPKPQEGMTVQIMPGGRILVRDQAVSAAALTSVIKRIAAAEPGLPVYLKADRGVPYGAVAEILGRLKDAGVENLSLVLEPKPRP
ncbi:MAG: biopolymer transporter ExbD [Candidatus Edwardsbacteria bacterium]|nr:biopolymer transporter ExbD [Candidatus Edwardsbacteria bacterium]